MCGLGKETFQTSHLIVFFEILIRTQYYKLFYANAIEWLVSQKRVYLRAYCTLILLFIFRLYYVLCKSSEVVLGAILLIFIYYLLIMLHCLFQSGVLLGLSCSVVGVEKMFVCV